MTAPPATASADRKLPRLALAATLILIVAPLVAFGVIRQQRVNEARAWARRAKPLLIKIANENHVEIQAEILPTGEIGIDEDWLAWDATPDDARRRVMESNPPPILRWTDWGPYRYLPNRVERVRTRARREADPPSQ